MKGTTGTQASFLELFEGDHDKVLELEQLVAKKMSFDATYTITGQTYSRKIDAQVLDLLSQGHLYKEIADKLGISYETVHTYVRRIYEKLQIRTRTEAVAKFLRR